MALSFDARLIGPVLEQGDIGIELGDLKARINRALGAEEVVFKIARTKKTAGWYTHDGNGLSITAQNTDNSMTRYSRPLNDDELSTLEGAS